MILPGDGDDINIYLRKAKRSRHMSASALGNFGPKSNIYSVEIIHFYDSNQLKIPEHRK